MAKRQGPRRASGRGGTSRGDARRATRKTGPTRPRPHAARTGVLRVTSRGGGIVQTAEGTFLISARGIGEAMDGDTVQVRSLGRSQAADRVGGLEGAVAGVLERATTSFAARFLRDGSLRVLVPLDERLCHDFVNPVEDDAPERLGVRDGDVVVARVASYPSRHAAGAALVERRVGAMSDERVPIEMIIASHDLATTFPDAAIAQAAGVTVDVDAALAEDPLRRDIRDRVLVTVDPSDARDFDDAVSLEPLPEGGWRLGVYIADVSHYVPWGSPVDLEARARGTSVYLADRVLPMLPERLCNDACSLVPDQDRLAMTCDLTLDARGRVRGCALYPSVIRSRARLTYEQVDALLDAMGGSDATGGAGRPASSPDTPDKRRGGDLAGRVFDGVRAEDLFGGLDRVRRLREGLRLRRGAIEFVTTETRAVLDEDGHAVDVRVRARTRATSLIEEAMLAANEAVARYLEHHETPAPFRVHEPPRADALAALLPRLGTLEELDAATKAGVLLGEPAALQRVLAQAAGRDVEPVVSAVTLRAMTRASYLPENRGHFGLGAQSYCHFTSPIRRYPDLMVHRMVKAQLHGRVRGAFRREMALAMPEVCKRSSKMERVAAEAAGQSQDVKLAEYLGDRLGQTYAGMVVGVTSFGLFVQLEGIGAQGLVRIGDLGGWCELDDETGEIVDVDSGRRWRLGQHLAVRVRAVDVPRGRVSLSVVGSGAGGPVR